MKFNLATLAGLRASLAYWKGKLAYRRRKHNFYHNSSKRPDAERKRLAAKWHKLVDEAQAVVAKRQKAIAARTRGKIRSGGGYAGSQGVVESLVRIGGENLTVTSTKRHNNNPYSGRGSDHDYRNTTAYANDISDGYQPTPGMDRAAYKIMRALGFSNYRQGQSINVNSGVKTIKVDGKYYRVQVIYRGSGPSFGGNHLNHIHIGVRKA